MNTTRRRFVQVSALAGGGLALGITLPRGGVAADDAGGPASLTAFLRIHPDGRIVFVSPNIEMGQGVMTSHSMIIAEELDADIDRFEAIHSPVEPAYNNPFFGMMGTGGSTSTPAFWMPLRQAGASARAMLIAAAAARWNLPTDQLRTTRGTVIAPDGSTLEYGELASEAAGQSVPENPPLKNPSEFTIVGKSTKRLEGPAKVTGEAKFGIDLQLPGMLTAVIARPPVFGGSAGRVRNEKQVRAMAGVKNIKRVTRGIAVIAESYWQAKRGAEALEIDWDEGPNANLSSERLYSEFEKLSRTPGPIAENHGEPEERLAGREDLISGTFYVPFLAHAPMEPLNATAHVTEKRAEVWAGTYLQTVDRGNIAATAGLSPDQVELHTMLAGGAFGRRATVDSDFVIDAVEAAMGEDAPVKAVWTREHDIQGGRYRPMAVHRIEAALGQKGLPEVWRQRVVTQSIAAGTPFESFAVKEGIDSISVEGAREMPYSIPHRRIELHSPDTGISGLWWRSVGHTHTAFAGEHFLDILAHEAGRDPLEYRMALLDGGDPRLLGVMTLAAEKAGWGRRLPEGHALGIAVRKSFLSYVCQVFECSVSDDGVPITHRVTCAVDVGIAVNPWNVEQQVQGAIAYAMTAALYGAIDIDGGRVRQKNFDGYRILRMTEMPRVDVHIVESQEAPTGIGEPGVPPVAPAMANARLALTGEPTWRLPYLDVRSSS